MLVPSYAFGRILVRRPRPYAFRVDSGKNEDKSGGGWDARWLFLRGEDE